MVKYITMKRITQILASILFVITVVTVYLAFDFAINNAISKKHSIHKHSHPDHNHPSDDIKITKRRSVSLSTLSQRRKSNRTVKHHDDDEQDVLSNERPTRNVKKQQQQALLGKPGNFHKGKTGVKNNKPQKSVKEQRKHVSTTTIHSQHKDKPHPNVKWNV